MKKQLFLSLLFLCGILAAQAQQKFFFKEDFEKGQYPAKWKKKSVAKDGGWKIAQAADVKSASFDFKGNTTYFASTNDDKCNCDKSNDVLITAPINLKGATTVHLAMKAFFLGFHALDSVGTIVPEKAFVQASTDAGATWKTLNAIETTANVDTVVASGNIKWGKRAFDLTPYNKDTAVLISFNYQDSGVDFFGLAIDDVEIYEPLPIEAGYRSTALTEYTLKAKPTTIKGKLFNFGSAPITDVEMSYTIAGKKETQKITGLNIPSLEKAEIVHPTLYNYAASGKVQFDVTIDKINGTVSTNSDTLRTTVLSKSGYRKPVFEEATGTWCTWCPRGAVFMDSIASIYKEEFIGVAVHNNDPMRVAPYNLGLTSTPGFGGFPSIIGDRKRIVDPYGIFYLYEDRKAALTPFDVSHTVAFDSISRKATIVVTAKSYTNMTGVDFRINAVLTEDNVKGTISGYNQVNAYSGGANGVMGGFELLPNPVPASKMHYNFVGRALLGDYVGTANSIPNAIKDGDVYTHTYTYTVPATMNVKNMKVVSLVLNNKDGSVMNGNIRTLLNATSVGVAEFFDNLSLNVYPNPMQNEATIELNTENTTNVNIRIFNLLGQTVALQDYGKLSGFQKLSLSTNHLTNGTYFLFVKTDNGLASRKIIIFKE
ncbi:MAG: hypothetical protein RLZZ292_3189 [Bacteroidota bacterium]|jgi:hypothetical protein